MKLAIRPLTCENETSPRGAGNTAEGSDPQIAYTIGGLRVSVPTYSSTVAHGAAAELIASAHLMAQGYHVFRALAASCPVDLVAYRAGELLKVEVKSVTVSNYTPALPIPVNKEWDLLVVVLTTGDALTLVPRPSVEQLRDDFVELLRPLGLLRSYRRELFVGGRRYHPRATCSHLIDGGRPYATTACGKTATAWPGEGDATERARAAALPLCKACARVEWESTQPLAEEAS